MQDLKTKPTKTSSKKQYINQNPIEAITKVGSGVIDSFKTDLAKGAVNEAWDELLGLNHDHTTKSHEQHQSDQGELTEGTELDLTKITQETVHITEMGREYAQEVIHAGKKAKAENSQETQVRIQEILIEIKKLSESSTELKNQVDIVTMEKSINTPNVYTENYLEKMLSVIRDLRLSVEDSLAWFKTLRNKNAARQYGSMAKKHGTSYTLSNERQIATQVG